MSLPNQCEYLIANLPNGNFIFENHAWLPWILNLSYVTVYSAVIYYVYKNKSKATFRTRSPRLIMVGYFLMMMDCVANTIILTKNQLNVDKFTYQCDFHICTTVLLYFSMMAVYFVRMWRVYKVFDLYQKYLD